MAKQTVTQTETPEIKGSFVTHPLGGRCYRITHVDRMPPFLTSLASDSNIWMYISSAGTLACGRGNANSSLFPYETDDKIHTSGQSTGPRTLIRVNRGGEIHLWEPFAPGRQTRYHITRNLLKSTLGNALTFEEINHDLGLTWQTDWNGAAGFGIVRTTRLSNQNQEAVQAEVMDGFRNILPHGLHKMIQDSSSCLGDAYKRSELFCGTGLGVYYLTSEIVDRPEVKEVLRANVVYSCGLETPVRLLSEDQLEDFAAAGSVRTEHDLKGRKGAYFVCAGLTLEAGSQQTWKLVAELGLTQTEVTSLNQRLQRALSATGGTVALMKEIDSDILRSSRNLRRILTEADGFQVTGDPVADVHHTANVLYNTMRGGYFIDKYTVLSGEFIRFVKTRNRPLALRQAALLDALPEKVSAGVLHAQADATGDPDMIRTVMEFLPLSFSRRHGDPSRPWNAFNIRFKGLEAPHTYEYEGNWRDVFQNWEAMSLSYPEYIENIIARFVNASTVDGFNPYRITQDGIDWEVLEPHNPWSSIGYWGDHQIIYLLKLLESSAKHHPGRLKTLMSREVFCYANVPYDLRPYPDMVRNVKDTVLYNQRRADKAGQLEAETGTDGRMLHGKKGIWYVNLAEKLMVPVLSKLSALVLDGGIWMNTLRPEWNDANNAIVGYGISVVTTCYLRRYLVWMENMLVSLETEGFTVSAEVTDWLHKLLQIMQAYESCLSAPQVSDEVRRRLLDACGMAFSDYRARVYAHGYSGKASVSTESLLQFIRLALRYVDHTLEANELENGMYHAYNLLELTNDGKRAVISHLYEMFEGQVAALSSGRQHAGDILRVLDSVEHSGMFREDLGTCTLYPVRELPRFLEKNTVPEEAVLRCGLLQAMLDAGDHRVIHRDAEGILRFSEDFRNDDDLVAVLDMLKSESRWAKSAEQDAEAVREIYESVFRHRAFTGRSGVMYKYEGIGCVYWHMNSKYLLAVQEAFFKARAGGEAGDTQKALKTAYYKVRSGLGTHKEPALWGAFPFDPYSHTPATMGAQQPGMTGQVKEEIITRRGELGVRVEQGIICFDPVLLQRDEFLSHPEELSCLTHGGEEITLPLNPGSLAFTLCQTPVVYHLSDKSLVRVVYADGSREECPGQALSEAQSRDIFARTGNISRLEVFVKEEHML